MATQKKTRFIGLGLLFLVVFACSAPDTTVPAPDNSAALTLAALDPTLTALAAPTQTILAPSLSPVPDDTPVPIVLASPVVPMAGVSVETNCRSGPGKQYDLIGTVRVGPKFVLVGKSSATNYWIIQLADGQECWLWGQYVLLEGNLAGLTEYPIPPTPLPPVGSVAGIIKTFGDEPIPNAKVTARNAGRTVTTAGDGRYRFDNLPAGAEYITAESSEFDSKYTPVSVEPGSVVTADFLLTMPYIPSGAVGGVEGRILIDGLPAAGVSVWLFGQTFPVTTDNAGHYRLSAYSGRYLLLAASGNRHNAVEVDVPADQTAAIPDITLFSR